MAMTYEQYEARARAIDTWARAQYTEGKMTEFQIERAVERMFDALDWGTATAPMCRFHWRAIAF
jgi:hypothetical protein